MAFAGMASEALSDQMNSLSDAHRQAGFCKPVTTVVNLSTITKRIRRFNTGLGAGFEWGDTLFLLLSDMFDMEAEGGVFPAYQGANHVGLNTRGPLKTNWMHHCPLEWSQVSSRGSPKVEALLIYILFDVAACRKSGMRSASRCRRLFGGLMC